MKYEIQNMKNSLITEKILKIPTARRRILQDKNFKNQCNSFLF